MQVGDLASCGEYNTIGVIVEMGEWNTVLVAPVDGEDMIWFHRSELEIVKNGQKMSYPNRLKHYTL